MPSWVGADLLYPLVIESESPRAILLTARPISIYSLVSEFRRAGGAVVGDGVLAAKNTIIPMRKGSLGTHTFRLGQMATRKLFNPHVEGAQTSFVLVVGISLGDPR